MNISFLIRLEKTTPFLWVRKKILLKDSCSRRYNVFFCLSLKILKVIYALANKVYLKDVVSFNLTGFSGLFQVV